MTKDSISNIITAFYKEKPDTIITGVYHFYADVYRINYYYVSNYNVDNEEWTTTLRENVDEE